MTSLVFNVFFFFFFFHVVGVIVIVIVIVLIVVVKKKLKQPSLLTLLLLSFIVVVVVVCVHAVSVVIRSYLFQRAPLASNKIDSKTLLFSKAFGLPQPTFHFRPF